MKNYLNLKLVLIISFFFYNCSNGRTDLYMYKKRNKNEKLISSALEVCNKPDKVILSKDESHKCVCCGIELNNDNSSIINKTSYFNSLNENHPDFLHDYEEFNDFCNIAHNIDSEEVKSFEYLYENNNDIDERGLPRYISIRDYNKDEIYEIINITCNCIEYLIPINSNFNYKKVYIHKLKKLISGYLQFHNNEDIANLIFYYIGLDDFKEKKFENEIDKNYKIFLKKKMISI